MKKQLLSLGFAAAATMTSQATLIADWDFSGASGTTNNGTSAAGTLIASSKNAVTANLTSTDLTGAGNVNFSDFNGGSGELKRTRKHGAPRWDP